MRLRIAHSSVYRYDPPTAGVIQVLRLTPRNHEGQYVGHWRIDVTPDARLASHEDAFGNITHVFTADGPLDELTVEVDGEVETQNTDGVVRGTVERFPPSLFLRDTALTQADTAIRDWAAKFAPQAAARCLPSCTACSIVCLKTSPRTARPATPPPHQRRSMRPRPLRASTVRPAGAQELGAQELGTRLAHIFIGAAHSLGIPARYVSGYFRKSGESADADTSHAWAEAYVPDLGWVGFDPSNGCLPDRCPCPRRHRARLARRRRGARHAHGRGRRDSTVAIKVGSVNRKERSLRRHAIAASGSLTL